MLYDINGNVILSDFNAQKWNGKKVIVDGDSLTSHGTWHTWLKEWFGWDTVYNHACSGNALTRVRTADDASGVGNGLKGYERVNQNYESDADAIILFGDGNDWSTLGTYADDTEDTWCGRMNLMIDAIITKYPLKPLILISNPPRNTSHGLGHCFDEQAIAMKSLSDNKNLYYIDCYHTNLYRSWVDASKEAFTNRSDGTHLNPLGSKMMAEMIFEELKKVAFDIG